MIERIPAKQMAQWHDLPNEIRNNILHSFCISIVFDFTHPEIDIWDAGKHWDLWDYDVIEWFVSPKCLKSFANALRTSRDFYDTITTQVRLDDDSPMTILQRIQYDHVRGILECLGDECDEVVNIALFFIVVGCFWRNPRVCESVEFITKVLWWIPIKSRLMLFSHLEQ